MITTHLVTGSGDLSSDFTYTDTQPKLGPIAEYVLSLTKKSRPKLCYIGTAAGDSPIWISRFYDACSDKSIEPSHLQLFKSPNHENLRNYLLSQDAIWVAGGSTANLLAVWKVHGVMEILREAWQKGIVLSGYSAGSVCWSAGGTTDSFGPHPLPFINKKSLLPFSSGVHDDIEEHRRPVFNQLVMDEKIPGGYVTEEGVSIHFIGTKPHKIISDTKDKFAYHVYKDSNGRLVEDRLESVLLKKSVPTMRGKSRTNTSSLLANNLLLNSYHF